MSEEGPDSLDSREDWPEHEGKSEAQREVAEIKNRRVRKGVLQYSVRYSDEKSERNHWVCADELDCVELKEKYENGRATTTGPKQKRVKEILGLSMAEGREMGYLVRFYEEEKPQVVKKAFMLRHCAKKLLEFYESNLHFLPKPGPEAKEEVSSAEKMT
jgi:hypothetical protein